MQNTSLKKKGFVIHQILVKLPRSPFVEAVARWRKDDNPVLVWQTYCVINNIWCWCWKTWRLDGVYITLLHIMLPGIEGAWMSDLIIFASIVFVKIYGRIDFSFFFFLLHSTNFRAIEGAQRCSPNVSREASQTRHGLINLYALNLLYLDHFTHRPRAELLK